MKRRKLIALLLMLSIILPSTMASAENHTDYFYSNAGTAGQYQSQPFKTITSSTLDSLYGGDVGVWFFYNAVGLQGSYVQSSSRTINLNSYAENGVGARAYIGTFSTVSGYYRPSYISLSYTGQNLLSNTSTAHLQLCYKVNTMPGDTSQAVPQGLICYQFWVY